MTMQIIDLRAQKRIIYEAVGGSHAYGLNTPESDKDIRGIYLLPPKTYFDFRFSEEEDEKPLTEDGNDVAFYSLRKYFQLAEKCNPNIIEMLWYPEDCILFKNVVFDELVKNRDLFVSKEAFTSHSSYAMGQIKKAAGKNKKVHKKEVFVDQIGLEKLRKLLIEGVVSLKWIESRFSKPFANFLLKTCEAKNELHCDLKKMDAVLKDENVKNLLPPNHFDFCYIIKTFDSDMQFPMRPIPLRGSGINLDEFNCSSLEHVGHVYRLYFYGEKAQGVFKSGEVVCSSIPIEDERSKYYGLLIYAENEYMSAKADWRSFWEWMSERNEHRWKDGDGKTFEYDKKNMQHTVRLLLSGENIVREGEPLVRFTGEKLKFLREIREGKFSYKYLLGYANEKIAELECLFENSSLPDNCDPEKLNELYNQLLSMGDF